MGVQQKLMRHAQIATTMNVYGNALMEAKRETTSASITSAEKELSAALHRLSDTHGGVVAQVERANNQLEYSLEIRAKTMDKLLHEWKSDLLRIWIPMVAAASILIGLFGGMENQGCRDAAPTAATMPMQTAVPTIPPQPDDAPAENPDQQTRSHWKVKAAAHREP